MSQGNFDAWPKVEEGDGDDPLPRLAREQGDPGRRGPGLRGFLPIGGVVVAPAKPAERDAREAMRIMREDYDKTSLASPSTGSEVRHHPALRKFSNLGGWEPFNSAQGSRHWRR